MRKINYFKNNLIFFFIVIIGVGCGGETRKLTKEELIYKPSDQVKFKKIKEEGGFLTNLFKKGKDQISGTFNKNESSKSNKSNPLWIASLEILSSFPLLSADANSGILITDWYSSERKPSQRFKITVLVLDQQIAPNSVQVKIHKQINKNSRWVNTKFDKEKIISIERKIIQRAVLIKEQSS